VHKHPHDTVWHFELHFHLLDPQVRGKSTVRFQLNVQFSKLMTRHERRKYFDRQHTEVTLDLVLQQSALPNFGVVGKQIELVLFLN